VLESILQGSVLTFIGAGIGYGFKSYEERPQPGLIIENIELSRESSNKPSDILIPDEVKQIEVNCRWIPSLPSKISYTEFEQTLETFSENVTALGDLCQGLSTIQEFVKEHANEESYDKEWQNFLRTNDISGPALNLFFICVAGCIRRKEVNLEQIKQKYPNALAEESFNDAINIQKKANDQTSSEDEDKATRLARAMPKFWFPIDLLEATETVAFQQAKQLPICQRLLYKLNEISSKSKYIASSNLVFVDALLVNNGRTPIAYDSSGVIGFSGIRKAVYLTTDANHQKISVPPQETRAISLRTDPLEDDLFTSLVELQKSEVLRCCLTMRIIRSTRNSQRWVSSPDTEFSKDLADVASIFCAHAHFPGQR
jgi:hypothetical protein